MSPEMMNHEKSGKMIEALQLPKVKYEGKVVYPHILIATNQGSKRVSPIR